VERTYIFNEKQYRLKVVYIGYILLAILCFSVFMVIFSYSILWLFTTLLSVYGAANTFLLQSNPREVIVSDEKITFRSYGQRSYSTEKLKFFRVRVSTAGYQVFIRVRDSDGNKGRFWVNFALFSDKEDLIEEFNYLERRVHPDSIRFSGRPDVGTHRPAGQASGEEDH